MRSRKPNSKRLLSVSAVAESRSTSSSSLIAASRRTEALIGVIAETRGETLSIPSRRVVLSTANNASRDVVRL